MVLIVLFCGVVARGGLVSSATTRPYSAITYTHQVYRDPAMHVHIVRVDLTNPGVHVVTSRHAADGDAGAKWPTTLQTVRDTAQADDLSVAVNGDFFMCRDKRDFFGHPLQYFIDNPADVCGWAMSDGVLWSSRPEPVSLVVDGDGKLTIGALSRPPPGARQIVSTMYQVVRDGRNIGINGPRHPRTAAGLDGDGKTLWLVVVDGRRPGFSEGMTLHELGETMSRLGCAQAMSLDGGGSSTLIMRAPLSGEYAVMNRPSDGHDLKVPLSVERPVANVLGVKLDGVVPSP